METHVGWVEEFHPEPFAEVAASADRGDLDEGKGVVVYEDGGPQRQLTALKQFGETLEIDTGFSCGSLEQVVQLGATEYGLTFRSDMGTNSGACWFYFRAQNVLARQCYRFHMMHCGSMLRLFRMGMLPAVHSAADARRLRRKESSSSPWRRRGDEVQVQPCNCKRCEELAKEAALKDKSPPMYSMVSFSLSFHEDDTIYIANGLPYTPESWRSDWARLRQLYPVTTSHCQIETICNTLGGREVSLLSITSQPLGQVTGARLKKVRGPEYVAQLRKDRCTLPVARRPVVLLMARCHPGETGGSFVLRGALQFLLSEAPEARELRELFQFKVIPMLNPDGVELGNSRCNGTPLDLNRQWADPQMATAPEVYELKQLARTWYKQSGIALVLDFHTHPLRLNSFICSSHDFLRPTESTSRLFPYLLGKSGVIPGYKWKDCCFHIEEGMKGTAQRTLSSMFGAEAFTYECSFGGDEQSRTHYSPRTLESTGATILSQYHRYCTMPAPKLSQMMDELKGDLTGIGMNSNRILHMPTPPPGKPSDGNLDPGRPKKAVRPKPDPVVAKPVSSPILVEQSKASKMRQRKKKVKAVKSVCNAKNRDRSPGRRLQRSVTPSVGRVRPRTTSSLTLPAPQLRKLNGTLATAVKAPRTARPPLRSARTRRALRPRVMCPTRKLPVI